MFTNEQLTGLNAASQRKLAGSATPEDIKNLTYAENNGYKYTAPAIPQTGIGVYASNRLSSNTLNNGFTQGSVINSLPSANMQAQQVYTNNTINDATASSTALNQQLNDIKAQQLKEAEANRVKAEADLKLVQTNEQNQINSYDTQVNPLKDQIQGQYKTLVDSISGVDYKTLAEQKVSLTNDVISYSKMMRDTLDQEASIPAINSVSQGRQNAVKENYTSKIATAQAAMSAIDGNFTLAFDILDKGSNAITQMTNDRINFLNTVKNLFATDKANANTKVLNLTADEKGLIERSITDLETKIKNVEANKQTIQKLMEENPVVAHDAGLLLTDTPDQLAQKLQAFYLKKPQYTPENQAWIKSAMQKYYDAGITMNDPIETVKSKILNSKIYEKDTAGKFTMTTDPITGQPIIFNSVTGTTGTMRTDRNNNPTAMTTDVAKALGLVEGVDYVKGDKFPDNPNLTTAKLLGDPIEITIKGLDLAAQDPTKQAFYTNSGQPRWTHTAISDQQWLAMTPEQKKSLVASMYQKEGGSGELLNGNTALNNMVNNSVSKPGYYDTLTPEQKKFVSANLAQQGKVPAQKQTQAQGQVSQDMEKAGILLDKLDELSGKVITSNTWMGNSWKWIGAVTKSNPDAALYNDTRDSFMSILSRSMGEKGVLTDQDIARIKKAIPSFTDSKDLRDAKISQLREIFDEIKNRAYIADSISSKPDNSDPLGVLSPSNSSDNDPLGLLK